MSSLFKPNSPFRIFATSIVISVLVLGLVLYYLGWQAAFVALMLVIIELTFSFDNAIINARVLMQMSKFWQKMFMTVGIFVAVFGMRIVFPILIVMFSSGLPYDQVINLAFNNPEKYAEVLESAQPSIAAFGGMFLLMLALHFFFDVTREVQWFSRIERPMQAIGRKWLHAIVCTVLLVAIVLVPANEHAQQVLVSGLIGIGMYLLIHGASELFTYQHNKAEKRAGKKLQRAAAAGLASFIYLEVLDASFSFDGVIGAFAVTKDVVLIAAGLGVGALWVRSLTLFIVHKRVLSTYRYLEHAAHYVIAALACTLLIGLFFEIPETLIGVLGMGMIALALSHSVRDNKKDAKTSEV
jgi:uncharacterized protein